MLAAGVCASTLVFTGGSAWAAKPVKSSSSTSAVGIDVSYPQCPWSPPRSTEEFAIVGLNGGLANDYNTGCFTQEWGYAQVLSGTKGQAAAQTYLNTGDPGNTVNGNIVADWPSSTNYGKYGSNIVSQSFAGDSSGTTCDGGNTPACAFIYGYDMVAGGLTDGTSSPEAGDLAEFNTLAGGQLYDQLYDQPTWLDVETTNSWQPATTTVGADMNIADLQGMVDAYETAASNASYPAKPIGIYSTSYQWGQITGTPDETTAGVLWGLPVWIPGARTLSGAQSNCKDPSFIGPTGTTAEITQWFGHPDDGDFSCVG